MSVLWLVLTMAFFFHPVWARFDTRSDEEAFIQSKLDIATKNTPHNQMEGNFVMVYADLYQLIDVDEKQGLINAKFHYYVYYVIPALAWNETDNNLTQFHVAAGTLWVPDIVGKEVTEELKAFEVKDQNIWSSGIVAAKSSLVNWKFACGFNVKYFPFDEQKCKLTFAVWYTEGDMMTPPYYLGIEPDMYGADGSLPLSDYSDNDQWSVVDAKMEESPDYEKVVLSLTLRRRDRYFFNVIVLPTVILALVSVLTFLLPVESGEKVSLAVTILLSQIVSLLVLNDLLPSSSLFFPLLGTFAMTTIILISISVVLAIIVINVHNIDPAVKVPKFVRGLFHSRLVHLVGVVPVPRKIQPIDEQSNPRLRQPSGPEKEPAAEVEPEEEQVTWPKVAVLCDRVAMLLYAVVMLTITVKFLLQLTTQS